jgi:protein involved in polysaccharide export with SLBB domain
MTVKPLIGVGDRLRVRNLRSSPSETTVEVDRTGMIRLPSVAEPINAKCLTERDLAREIGERISVGETRAAVDVAIAEYGRASLVVAGAVYLPGSFRVRSTLTLQEGLRLASGSTPLAGRFIYVVRGSCEGRSEAARALGVVETYDLAAAQENGFPDVQRLRGGDTVFVPPGGSFIVAGGVSRPGLVRLSNAPTLAEALASVGGVVPGAPLNRISVWRLTPGETAYKVYPVNLEEIEAGRAGQVVIRPGDIIEVPIPDETKRGTQFAALLERIALNASRADDAENK